MEGFVLLKPVNKARRCNRRANKYQRKYGYTKTYMRSDTILIFYFLYDHCLGCGSPEVTIDHITPLSIGGAKDISNLQPLCEACNSSKGSLVVDYRLEAAHGEY